MGRAPTLRVKDVILLLSSHEHVSATHVAIFRVVRTRMSSSLYRLYHCSPIWIINHHIQSGPKKCIHSLLISIFGISYDSVWMPMVATSNTYIESKIQGHLSYQFCFCINTVVMIIEQYFSCQSVYTLFWATLYYNTVFS